VTEGLQDYTLEQYVEIEDMLGYRSEFHDGFILPVEDATPTPRAWQPEWALFLTERSRLAPFMIPA